MGASRGEVTQDVTAAGNGEVDEVLVTSEARRCWGWPLGNETCATPAHASNPPQADWLPLSAVPLRVSAAETGRSHASPLARVLVTTTLS